MLRNSRLTVLAVVAAAAAMLVATSTPVAARTKMTIPLGDRKGNPISAEEFTRELTSRLGKLSIKNLRKLYKERGGKCGGPPHSKQKKQCASKQYLVKAVAKQMAAARAAALKGDKDHEPTDDDLAAAHRELGKVSLKDFKAMLRDAAKDDGERGQLTDDVVQRMYARLQEGLRDPDSIKRHMKKKQGSGGMGSFLGNWFGWRAGGAFGSSDGGGGGGGGGGGKTKLPSEYVAGWLGLDREEGPSWFVMVAMSLLAVLQIRLMRSRVRDHGWRAIFVPTSVLRRWKRNAQATEAAKMKKAAPKDADIDGLADQVAELTKKLEKRGEGEEGGGGGGGGDEDFARKHQVSGPGSPRGGEEDQEGKKDK